VCQTKFPFENARSFAEGWQCNVYLFENYAIKEVKDFDESLRIVRRQFRGAEKDLKEVVKLALENASRSIALLEEKRPPPELTAYFEPIGNGFFLQHRVQSLGRVIQMLQGINADRDIVNFLEKYLTLVKSLWRYELHETSWKFNKNAGVDRGGSVVLLDCLELSGSISVAESDLKERRWRKMQRIRGVLPLHLVDVFVRMCEETLTVDSLHKEWGHRAVSRRST